MKLTAHTDYGLRILMALAVLDNRRVTIEELADRHRISRNHLTKVAQTLVGLGLVKSARGRGGGLTLAKAPEALRMGDVVRALETDMALVACLGDEAETCMLSGACRLTGAFRRAANAFFSELNQLTLADLVASRMAMRRRLALTA